MRRLGYVAAMMLLVVLVTEGAVRVLGIAPELPAAWIPYSTAPYLVWGPKPLSEFSGMSPTNEFRFDLRHNRWGFRDVEHELRKPAGTFRILGLGDSFTYGWGADFEQTYLYRLESALNAAAPDGPRVEIVKAGVARFFPGPERILLDRLGRQFSPDLIIVGFIANDVLDTCMGIDAVAVGADGALVNRPAALFGAAGGLAYRYSHAARILLRAWSGNMLRRCSDYAAVYADNGRYEPQWLEIEAELTRMAAIATDIGARLLVINIPDVPPWDESRRYPGRRLGAWAARNGAEFLDLLPAMQAAAAEPGGSLYWKIDPHCTPRGYGVIAASLERYLLDTGPGLSRR